MGLEYGDNGFRILDQTDSVHAVKRQAGLHIPWPWKNEHQHMSLDEQQSRS